MSLNRLNRSLRATFLGLAVNVFLAGGKLAAGLLGNSYALIADAVESFADVFSSIVVWRGLVVAAAPADKEHPYGHGKAEPIAAAMVSTMLLFAAVGIISQAVREILHPSHVPAPFTLVVLLVVIVTKEFLYRFVLRAASEVESSAVRADASHHRSDAITSAAALVGITIAIVGGPRYKSADCVAAIVAAGIIAYNGWRLLGPALNELMDASPGEGFTQEVQRTASSIPGVDRVEKCMVRKMGYLYFIDLHIEVDPALTVSRAHAIAHEVKDAIRNAIPQVSDVLVHIEPSGRR